MSETQLASAAIAAIRLAFPSAIPIRIQSGTAKVRGGYMHLAPKGTPDWLIILPESGCCWLEVKRESEKPTDEQLAMHTKLRARRQAVYVVHSINEAVECVRAEVRKRCA